MSLALKVTNASTDFSFKIRKYLKNWTSCEKISEIKYLLHSSNENNCEIRFKKYYLHLARGENRFGFFSPLFTVVYQTKH